jgi:hypothetical protein
LQIDGRGYRDVVQMGLLDPSISRPPHPQGKGRLRYGAFDPCPTFVELFERFRLLSFPCRLQCHLLGFGV